jgi:hypothetical protein
MQHQLFNTPEASFEWGKMSVQLNQDFYEPGQLMIGMIYLSISQPF